MSSVETMLLGRSTSAPPSTVAGLLASIASRPGPALTYYAAGGDADAEVVRVELTGKVLAQWAYKCANLLYEEGVAPGDVVGVDLQPTWRALPWVLGAWLQGAGISVSSAGVAALITDHPGPPTGTVTIALPRDPLAMRCEDLPAGILDGAADAAGQADAAIAPAPAVATNLALKDGGISFGELFTYLGQGGTGRVLIEPTDWVDLVHRAAATLLAGGSVVVIDRDVRAEQRDQAIKQEKVSVG